MTTGVGVPNSNGTIICLFRARAWGPTGCCDASPVPRHGKPSDTLRVAVSEGDYLAACVDIPNHNITAPACNHAVTTGQERGPPGAPFPNSADQRIGPLRLVQPVEVWRSAG